MLEFVFLLFKMFILKHLRNKTYEQSEFIPTFYTSLSPHFIKKYLNTMYRHIVNIDGRIINCQQI